MTQPKIGKNDWKQEIARAIRATNAALACMDKLVRDSDAGPGPRYQIYSQISHALSINLQSLMALKEIGDNSNGAEPKE